jgi:hypothetical protein
VGGSSRDYAQLVEAEDTLTVMAGLREVIQTRGVFCSLYSDRASHFFVTPKGSRKVDWNRLMQVGRALQALGVKMIQAYSPQARGREAAQRPNRGWPKEEVGRVQASERSRLGQTDATSPGELSGIGNG